MYQLSKFSLKRVLGIIWVSGSAALVLGLMGFPRQIGGAPFFFLAIQTKKENG